MSVVRPIWRQASRRAPATTSACLHPSPTPLTRNAYHASARQQQKDKKSNLLDKDSINTDANEYSKSAGDSTSAATEDAAFSTDKTRPEEQHDAAAREAEKQGISNPLNASPANHDISQPRKGTEGGAQGSEAETGVSSKAGRSKMSGGGSSPKAGGKTSGGGGHM